MEHKTIKRIGAASLVALHIFTMQAWAQTICSAATGLGAVFSVMGEGVINLTNDGENGQCNPTFYNASQVNAQSGKLVMSGTDANKKNCQSYASGAAVNSNTTTSISVTGSSIPARVLATYQQSESSFDLLFPNGSQIQYGNTAGQTENANGDGNYVLDREVGRSVSIQKTGIVYTVPGGDYDQVSIKNGNSIVFTGPVRIKKLSMSGCNGAGVTLAQDVDGVALSESYIDEVDWAAACNLSVSGTGRATLNVLGKNSSNSVIGLTLNGGPTCVNYADCSGTKDWANMDAQHPERLQINIYNGNLTTQGNFSLAAGVYVNDGNFSMGNGSPVTVVGEILAKNVSAQNNSQTKLFSKTTAQTVPRDGAYSLTPPVTGEVTDKDSLVYRALQKDSPGTSGYLAAFKLKDDSSQDTTVQWSFGALDTATSKVTTIADRASKLRTEVSGWANVAVDFSALSTTASNSTLSQACVVDPTQTACRVTGDKRNISSLVGTPWRIAPMIVGESVLFATDDGVLYSVDKATGALNWGWVPSAILTAMQAKLDESPKALLDAHPWGQIASVDVLEDDDSNPPVKVTKTYVTGTALGGKLHFSIQVGTNGKTLEKIVWLDSRATEYSPGSAGNTNDGEAGWSSGVYGRPYGGAAPISAVVGGDKVAYVVGGKLVTREVNGSGAATESVFHTGSESATITAAVVPSSNLLYVDDSAIYLGAADGKVYKSNISGLIVSGDHSIDKVTISTPASAIWYVNGSRITSASGNGLMLLAQTQYQVSALKYFSEKWSFAWSSGISPTTKLGVSSPATNPAIGVLASDNAYLSAPADIINGVVLMYYTKKPSACDIRGYTFGPLKLLDGTDAKSDSLFRNDSMTNLDNYVGKGDATGGAFTRWKGKRAIIAGTGGDPSNAGDTAAISPPENVFRDRLNWRELTNFF